MITFEEFTKVDLRIGTVRSADIVEDADLLLKLSVDFGEAEARTIVSGIRQRVENPEHLIGKQFLFVINIPPRTIRGHESNGMILGTGEGDDFAFIVPSKEVVSGAPLR